MRALRVRGSALPSLRSLDVHGNVIQIDSFSKIAFPGLACRLVYWSAEAQSSGCDW